MPIPSEPFWMVYGEDQSSPRVCHHNFELAEREAKRLAALNPGIRFFVMAPVGVAQKIEVTFRPINLSDIPL